VVTLTACALYICTAAQGYSFWVFGPEIVKTSTGEEAPLWTFIGNELCGVAANIGVSATIDEVGRRPLLHAGNAIGLSVLAVLAFRPPLLMACLAWLLIGCSQSILWGAASVYISEVFPTHLRGTGNGLAQTCSRLVAGLCPLLVGVLLERSLHLTLRFIAIPLILSSLVTAVLMNETAKAAVMD